MDWDHEKDEKDMLRQHKEMLAKKDRQMTKGFLGEPMNDLEFLEQADGRSRDGLADWLHHKDQEEALKLVVDWLTMRKEGKTKASIRKVADRLKTVYSSPFPSEAALRNYCIKHQEDLYS